MSTIRYIVGWEVCKVLTKRAGNTKKKRVVKPRTKYLKKHKTIAVELHKTSFDELTLISPGGCCQSAFFSPYHDLISVKWPYLLIHSQDIANVQPPLFTQAIFGLGYRRNDAFWLAVTKVTKSTCTFRCFSFYANFNLNANGK